MVNDKYLIALCSSRIYDPQIHGFIKILNEKLRVNNCTLMIFAINSDIYWEEDLNPAETYVFDIMPYDELDCIVLMDEKIKSHTVSNKIIKRANKNHVPVVVVDGQYDGTIRVNFDYAKGFEEVTRHIIEHHHVKRPHIMAGLPDNYFSDQRIDIFKRVIAENGIEFDESMLSYGHFWADPTIEAMHEILKRNELPDAIICANDIMAINVCDVLTSAGISVPDQIVVSGFDGYDEIYVSSPKITSVSCDSRLLADATGDTVLNLVHGEPVSDTYIVPELITNESCGCSPHSWNANVLMTRFNTSFYRHQDDLRILYNITSNMETSLSPWEMAASIHNHKTKTHLCIVDKYCFDSEQNYFTIPDAELPKKNLHIINDADYAEDHRFEHNPLPESVFYDPTVNQKESVLSGGYRSRIIELTETGYPLVFNALDYMNRPFGFNCYYFQNYIITNYSRAASVTNAISQGVGGFVNLQYQRTLLKKMDTMYRHDALTGLYNRLGFQNTYEQIISLPENQGQPITVIMCDLDGLKYINDTFGHAAGDIAISTVASALVSACPKSALAVRFGGDELFAVMIGNYNIGAILTQIRLILDNHNSHSGEPYKVATSCGAYTVDLTKDFDLQSALKKADEIMYHEKDKKKH